MMRSNTRKGSRRFLSVIEAAGYLNRHRSTLDKWRAENIVLPFYKDNEKIMYAIDDLNNYLQSCRIEPVAYGFTQSHINKNQNDKSAAELNEANTKDIEKIEFDLASARPTE